MIFDDQLVQGSPMDDGLVLDGGHGGAGRSVMRRAWPTAMTRTGRSQQAYRVRDGGCGQERCDLFPTAIFAQLGCDQELRQMVLHLKSELLGRSMPQRFTAQAA